MFDETFYRSGYSIGVGGVVLCGNKVLLVRSVQGEAKDEWAIPGGFVEHQETIDVAVQLRALTRMLAIRVLEGKMQVLTFHPHPSFSPSEYVLFL